MAVEQHYHNDVPATDSSAMTTIVAIIAILFILGLGFFALQSAGYLGGAAPADTDNSLNMDINTNVPTTPTAPGTTVNP